MTETPEAAGDGAEFLGVVGVFTLLHSVGREIDKNKKVQHECRGMFVWATEAPWNLHLEALTRIYPLEYWVGRGWKLQINSSAVDLCIGWK